MRPHIAEYASEVTDERYPLGDDGGYALFRRHPRYLRVEGHGNPSDADEATRYLAAVERAASELGAALFVAQKTGDRPLSPHWNAIRDARWKALAASRLERIAVVVDDELGASRVQMTAVAMKAPVRAFVDESAAIAWLVARARERQ